MIIGKPLDHRSIRYDADRQALDIGLGAFVGPPIDYETVFGSGAPYENVVAWAAYPIDVVISDRQVALGSFIGSTRLGAKIRVTRLRRTTMALYVREGASSDDHLFEVNLETNAIATLPMDPARAKAIKPTLTGAVVISPRSPYTAANLKDRAEPTLDDPRLIDHDIGVIVADVRCGLILNEKRKVLAAIEGQ